MRLYARSPDEECPWVRVVVPKRRRDEYDEVIGWLRETWGPRTQIRAQPETFVLTPCRASGRWSFMPLRHPRLQLRYQGIAIFDIADVAVLMMRFEVEWSATIAKLFWSTPEP